MAQKISSLLTHLVDLESYSEFEVTDQEAAQAIQKAEKLKARTAKPDEPLELTEFEKKYAIMQVRQQKAANVKMKEYREKVFAKEPDFKKHTAEELREQIRSIFNMDEFNEDIIWQLCLYFSKDQRCSLDLKKGIFLYGGVGVGKSCLMEFFRHNQSNSYAVISARQIAYEFTKNGDEAFNKYKALMPTSDYNKTYGQRFIGLCLDDIGTEVDRKHYGNESNVIAELLLNRYDNKGLAGKTHVTSNLNTTQLEERYGPRVRSRLREMMNVLIFDDSAPDRRK